MKKETLQNITNLSAFIFDEAEYNRFMNLISNNQLQWARTILDDKLDKLDLLVHLNEDDEVLLSQYKHADQLEDILMDLIINEVENEEGKQIRNIAQQ